MGEEEQRGDEGSGKEGGGGDKIREKKRGRYKMEEKRNEKKVWNTGKKKRGDEDRRK